MCVASIGGREGLVSSPRPLLHRGAVATLPHHITRRYARHTTARTHTRRGAEGRRAIRRDQARGALDQQVELLRPAPLWCGQIGHPSWDGWVITSLKKTTPDRSGGIKKCIGPLQECIARKSHEGATRKPAMTPAALAPSQSDLPQGGRTGGTTLPATTALPPTDSPDALRCAALRTSSFSRLWGPPGRPSARRRGFAAPGSECAHDSDSARPLRLQRQTLM